MTARSSSLRELRPAARAYISAVIAAAALIVAGNLVTGALDRPYWLLAFIAVACAAAAIKVSIPLLHGGSSLSLSYAASFTALLVLGVEAAVLVAASSALMQCTLLAKEPNPPHRTLFSMATLAVTVQGAGLVYGVVAGGDAASLTSRAGGVVAATLVYYFLNTLLVAAAIALATGLRVLGVWRDSFLWSAPSYLLGSAVAVAAAELVLRGLYLWTILIPLPIYLLYRSYSLYLETIAKERTEARKASDVQLKIIEALVLAIEAKDSTSQAHLHALQTCAEELARAIGLSEAEVRCIGTAALLHDIGNLAVPDHILSKPAALTYEEYEKVKIHARVGAEILRAVPFPLPVAPLVLAHHERWDGRGYPSGIAGDEIPLGARVLAVADNFTALISERPHRPARTPDEALEIVKQRAGKVLDPELVSTFVHIMPALDLRLGRLASTPGAGLASPLADHGEGDAVLEEIAVAHREAMALQEIAQGFGSSLGVVDTMNMIHSRLDKLIPLAGCALFLWNRQSERFECRHAAGAGADLVARATGATVAKLRDAITTAGGPQSALLSDGLACPLSADGSTYGALVVYHAESNTYDNDHRRLLQRVSQQATTVVQNALVFDQTREASLTDSLTGLANRRSLQAHLARELSRASRESASVAVMVLDLDAFKQVNDRFGHDAGDATLCTVARDLQAAVRPYDFCARIGGDEFVVVLWDCAETIAERKGLELQETVSATRLETESGDVISLGISVGIAIYDRDGTTAEQLLAVADKRMYANKDLRRAALGLEALATS